MFGVASDGITEAVNGAGEMFGEAKLAAELEGRRTDPDEVAASLWAAVRAWQGKEEPDDDQTVMVVIRE